MRVVPFVPILLALTAFPAAGLSLSPAAAGEDFLVGYDPEERDAALLSIRLSGGHVHRENADLDLALVHADDPARFTATIALSPGVEFVETNDPTALNGAQWNGAQWNGAQWNGAQWNGAEWNGAQWNGAQWNGAEWNARYGEPSKRNDPGLTLQWGLAEVNAPRAWDVTTGGRDATLCVLDSGIAWDHADLVDNVWTGPSGEHGWNAITGTSDAYDDAGHGTHVAGIAAATVRNAHGVAGVGNVRLMAVKVLDSAGHGTEADLAFGIAWCARHGADVAVMALGVTEPGPSLERALDFAARRDVVLVASAGNGGPCDDCVGHPADDPRVVAVTALGKDRALAPFSSRGPETDLAAPGVDIISTFPGDRYVYGSGTSQAVGFVAGAAALLRDAEPGLSAGATRGALERTAVDLGTPGKDASYGAGLLDVEAALADAR